MKETHLNKYPWYQRHNTGKLNFLAWPVCTGIFDAYSLKDFAGRFPKGFLMGNFPQKRGEHNPVRNLRKKTSGDLYFKSRKIGSARTWQYEVRSPSHVPSCPHDCHFAWRELMTHNAGAQALRNQVVSLSYWQGLIHYFCPCVRVSSHWHPPCICRALNLLRPQLVLETNLASRWEGVRLPRASGKAPDFPGSSPNFPRSFSATSPEVLSLWNLTAIQGFPGSFPDFPGSSPNFPGGFLDFPGFQPLFLGSPTPSLDSQKLPLIVSTGSVRHMGIFQNRSGKNSEFFSKV